MSPIEAAATAIDIHNTAAKWNKALLDNSARPSGALVYSGRVFVRDTPHRRAHDGRAVRTAEGRVGGELPGLAQRRPAAALGRRARLEGAEPLAEGHGFHRSEARGGARNRAGLGRAADAVGYSRRQHVFKLPGSTACILARHGAAAGQPHGEGVLSLVGARRLRFAGPAARRGRGELAGRVGVAARSRSGVGAIG